MFVQAKDVCKGQTIVRHTVHFLIKEVIFQGDSIDVSCEDVEIGRQALLTIPYYEMVELK